MSEKTTMSGNDDASALCGRVSASLIRNGYADVRCEHDGSDFRLTGTVKKESDRAVAYALARTTIGMVKVVNAIEVSD
jgi:osmotically-inducible protein OsmY